MQYTATTTKKVYDDIKRNPLTREEGLKLVERYKMHNDEEALNEIVERNFHTFYHIVFKTAKITQGHHKFDDYFQATAMGYIKAIKRFNLDFGLSLNTYCYECARRELEKYIQEKEDLVKINHHVYNENLSIIYSCLEKKSNRRT